MLCYFRDVETCVAFGERIYAHLPPIPNREAFFGRQQVMNEQDEEIAVEERLLISALDLGFEDCARLIHEAGGLCVPAHINRGANGLLMNLGFMPETPAFSAVEVWRALPCAPEPLEGRHILHSSDAHYLGDILEREFALHPAERSVRGLLHWMDAERKKHQQMR